MRALNEKDIKNYVSISQENQPFMSFEELENNIKKELKDRKENGKDTNFLKCVFAFIHHNIRYKDSQNIKFKRNAFEIWNSKFATGCTDYSLLFSIVARQFGIPCTILHTASLKWIKTYKTNEMHLGHTFCECFFDGKWILVDATARKIIGNYNIEKIALDYEILNEKIFIPYRRDLELSKTSTKKVCSDMDDFASKYIKNKIK